MGIGFKPLEHEPTVAVKFFSAGTAACIADLFTYPLDMAKVRLQIQGEGSAPKDASGNTKAVLKTQLQYRGMFHTLQTIAKEEGPRALYNGLVPGLQRQMCFASVRIGFYDSVKRFYMGILGVEGRHAQNNVPMRILAGVTTGAAAVICAQPTDVVKVRMQAPGGKQRYKGCIHAYKTIAQKEGIRGLWKGSLPNITRNAVVNAAELVSYDLIKENIIFYNLLSDNFPCHFLSAFGAGFITTCCASPVDVVKTRFMNSRPGQYKGALNCAALMFKEGGFSAFYKGFIPNYVRLGSWNIFTFVFFEQLKRGFSQLRDTINEHLN